MSDKKEVMKALIKVPIAIAWSIGNIFLFGVVLSDAWRWFITPTFGIKPLELHESIGIAFFATLINMGIIIKLTFLIAKYGVKKGDESKPLLESFVFTFIYLVFWGGMALWNWLYIAPTYGVAS